ncbi:MAG: hypothetical protein MJ252_13640 [archaeon]|nr:hypothetical protein [archaeon]
MSSLFIGELGEPVMVTQSHSSGKPLYDKYLSDLNLSPSDIIIFDSRGQLFLQLNDKDDSVDNKYYIYTKKFSSDAFQSYFEDNLQKLISSYNFPISLNQNNLPEIHQNYSLLEENSKFLKISPLEIKSTFEKMLEFFENFQVVYKTIKINSKICEKIKDCFQYQYCGINSIVKHINGVYNLCEKAKQEVGLEYEKLLDIKNSAMKDFADSVEKLKKTELHPKMQTSSKKFLIDLYYDEEKMNNWKDTCIGHTEHFANALSEKNKYFLNEGNKIVNEKSSSILDIKNEWNSLGTDYEKIVKEIENRPSIIFNELLNDFLEFKNAIINIVELLYKNQNNMGLLSQSDQLKDPSGNLTSLGIIEENCNVILNLRQKYSNFLILNNLQDGMEPLNDLCSKMRKSMESFSKKIHNIFINFSTISNSLIELTDKYNNYLDGMKSLEDSFSSFKSSSYFPLAYNASIEEIKRRIIFNKKIKQNFDLIDSMVFKENANRKEFIQNYGKYLPSEYYPSLKFYNLKLTYHFQNENEVNLLPNLLSEEEEQYLTESNLKANLLENSNFGGAYYLNGVGPNYNLISSLSNSSSNVNMINNNIAAGVNDAYSSMISEKEKMINTITKELEMSLNNIQYLNEQVQSFFNNKDLIIKEKNSQIENLKKSLNSKLNGKLDQCPICNENATNPSDYTNWTNFVKEMQKRISEKDKTIEQLESKLQNVIMITNQMKKTYFNHLNLNLVAKNKEISNLKSVNYSLESSIKSNVLNENEVIKLKKIIDQEKTLTNSYISELKVTQSKLDNVISEKRKLEKNFENYQAKLNNSNEKMLQYLNDLQKTKGENEKMLKLIEEQQLQNMQIKNLLKISQNENKDLKLEIENLKQKGQRIEKGNSEKEEEIGAIENSSSSATSAVQKQKQKINEISPRIIGNNLGNKPNTQSNELTFKNIKEGSKCIFVPYGDGVYICINLSENLSRDNAYKCDIVLDLDSFDDDRKDLIIENSLIIIGTVEEFKDYEPNTNTNRSGSNNMADNASFNYNLPEDPTISYKLAKLKSIDYILGFPGEEFAFVNYNSNNFNIDE